jgi:uncharacterized protein (DUF362 family)
MKRVCSEENLELVKFNEAVMLDGFPIARVVKEVDAIISLPKFKSHIVTVLTGGVKNMFGAVIGPHKAQCHLKALSPSRFASILAHVYSLARPTLSVMDGVVGMEGEGPSAGRLRNFGIIMASADAVSMDAVFAKMVGIDPRRVPTTPEAERRACGIADLRRIDIAGEKLEDAAIKNFKLPKTSAMFNLAKSFICAGEQWLKFYVRIEKGKCEGCGLCFKICPASAIEKTGTGGYKVNDNGCARCFCCYEACPHKAITLKKSLLAKVIIR